MTGFNLSALAVRERAITLFVLLAITFAGIYSFARLGRAEDPAFAIKVITVSAVWPGAIAEEMQNLVAEPLGKRLQELRWYDRVETFTRPGVVLMTLSLQDSCRRRTYRKSSIRRAKGSAARHLLRASTTECRHTRRIDRYRWSDADGLLKTAQQFTVGAEDWIKVNYPALG
jgi:multidrug efflux pump subunit AcrB